MKRLLALRERQGWSWTELSRRSGLPVWKLHWWHRRLASHRSLRRPGRTFVSVQVVDSPRGDGPPLEVITPSGVRILVPADFQAEHLRRVLQALEAAWLEPGGEPPGLPVPQGEGQDLETGSRQIDYLSWTGGAPPSPQPEATP